MLEVGDEALDGVHHLLLGEVGLGEYLVERGEEVIYLAAGARLHVGDYAEACEARQVNVLAWHIEFLVRLLAGGVAAGIYHRVLAAAVGHLGCVALGFLVGGAEVALKACGLHEVIADA